MTTPNERTRAIVLAWEFLRELSVSTSIPVALRNEAHALLRHYPLPHELIGAARLVPSLLAEPAGYVSDTRKPNTVRTLIELLSRFDPDLRVVVDEPDVGFIDLRSVAQVSLPPDPPSEVVENASRNSTGLDVEQVVWITGIRLCNADWQVQVNSKPKTSHL